MKRIYSLDVYSEEFFIRGKCDLVELIKDSNGCYFSKYDDNFIVYPVEFKRGKPKLSNIDVLQLVAQAICLEEMLSTFIEKGSIYYFETNERTEVLFTEELRSELIKTLMEMRMLYQKKKTPKAIISKSCNTCSLNEICIPNMPVSSSVREYIEKRINE